MYDTIDTLLANADGKAVLLELMQMLSEKLGVPAGEGLLSMFGGFTVHQLMCAAGEQLPEGFEAQIHEKLQAILKA